MNARPNARLVKKITASVIAQETGNPVNPNLPSPIKESRVLFDLFGIAVKVRTGHTNMGDWVQFIGQFEAVTPDGEVFAAPRCHIAQPFEDMLYTQLATAQEKDAKASVQFACRVEVVPPVKGKPSAVGYEYRVTPLIEAEGSNPLALLREAAYKNAPPLLAGGTSVAGRAIPAAKRA